MLITLKINNEDYVIVIENKLESLIYDKQLPRYVHNVEEKFKKYKQLRVFLSPDHNLKQVKGYSSVKALENK